MSVIQAREHVAWTSHALTGGVERRKNLAIFITVFAFAMVFAVYTDHAWDDHYITYRPAKNLATGHGLVFNPGEKVHTFTSPSSVLMLALLSKATNNTSDTLVLWMFRTLSAGLLGTAAVLLFRIARHRGFTPPATLALLGMFGTDAKILDFTINGQEVGFMMLFLTLALYAVMVPSRWPFALLGVAGAGLQWTRPDGFVYLAALALGILIFDAADPAVAKGRRAILRLFLLAGIIATLLYLPWLVWAWSYYGSPIPHTVIAKGLRLTVPVPRTVLKLVVFPLSSLVRSTSISLTFLPIYPETDDWSYPVVMYGRLLGWACAVCWLVPHAPRCARAASVAFMASHFYQTYIAGPAPWYLPSSTLLGIVVCAFMVQHGSELVASHRGGHDARWSIRLVRGLKLGAGALVVSSGLLALAMAYEVRAQQRIIAEGNYKPIGVWLREHATSSSDTVFSEPLGYIGYFSQLRVHDVPGLASLEMIAARRTLNTDEWHALIAELRPDWLVLRPDEAGDITRRRPSMLSQDYTLVKTFDATRQVESYAWLPGRNYLIGDRTFFVFRRQDRPSALP